MAFFKVDNPGPSYGTIYIDYKLFQITYFRIHKYFISQNTKHNIIQYNSTDHPSFPSPPLLLPPIAEPAGNTLHRQLETLRQTPRVQVTDVVVFGEGALQGL